MKTKLKHLTALYFLSLWIPTVVVLSVFGLLCLNELVLRVPFLGLGLLAVTMLSLLGVLVAGIVQLAKGLRLGGVLNLIALPVVSLIVVLGFGLIAFAGLFNDAPDNFGKDIVIPADLKVSDPVKSFDEPGESVSDPLTESIVAAFTTNSVSTGAPRVTTDLAVLNEFATTNRQRLIEHLSASRRWFVTEERGKPYAYRRLTIGGRWENTLNGFYSSFGVAPGSAHFQTRVVLGFDGPVFADPFRRKDILTTAQVAIGDVPIRVVDDKRFSQGKESYFVLQGSRASLEIFEQSRLDIRSATQLALNDVKTELEAALTATNRPAPPPPAAVRAGGPEIQLASGMQGGIYQVRAFANPGEAGRVYLKVFEATRNTPLSAGRIKPRSTARIGWSANPSEMFRYQCEITVYEGDWGTFYPARFEFWFIPDSGKPERRLVEWIFRIEGWMR